MRKWLALSPCGALALGVAACGDDDDDQAAAAAEAATSPAPSRSTARAPSARSPRPRPRRFQGENPNVKVTVGTSGTGGGFEKFCAGETDISDASRPIKDDEEVPVCKKNGVTYKEVQVANDGIAVVTNKALEDRLHDHRPAQEAVEQGLEGHDLQQLDPKFPDAKVSLFGPGTDSGTFDFFTEEINGEEGVTRKDYQPSEDDNVLVQGVEGDEGGLGYFGFSYYEQNQDKLNLVGGRRRRRLRQAEHRDDPGRQLQAALAAAVHVPERRSRWRQAAGQGVHGLRDRQPGRRSPRPRRSSR